MRNIKEIDFDELFGRLPELIQSAIIKCEQDPKYHPEGNCYNHIKLVFEYAKNTYEDADLMVCAIFHDMGKPETQRISARDTDYKGDPMLLELKDLRISNIGHETKCRYYINKYFDLFSDISTNKEKVIEICEQHMRAHLYTDKKMSKKSKRNEFESLTYFNDIINFSNCDENGK
jgi:hypothetical protein